MLGLKNQIVYDTTQVLMEKLAVEALEVAMVISISFSKFRLYLFLFFCGVFMEHFDAARNDNWFDYVTLTLCLQLWLCLVFNEFKIEK